MIKQFQPLLNMQFVRYFAASAGALAVDMGSFLLLLRTPMPAGLCAAISYVLGMVAIWLFLSRAVFESGTHDTGPARTRQKVLFLILGWGGLAITTGIVSLADAMHANVQLSKVIAVGVSFAFNYLVRKHYIFTADQQPT